MDWNALPDGQWVVTLYFGLSRLERSSVTEEEWVEFLETVVSPIFRTASPCSTGLVNILIQGGTLSSQFGQRHSLPRHLGQLQKILMEFKKRVPSVGFQQISVGLTVVLGHTDFGPALSA